MLAYIALLLCALGYIRADEDGMNYDSEGGFDYENMDPDQLKNLPMGTLGAGTDVLIPNWFLLLIFLAIMAVMASVVLQLLNSGKEKPTLSKKERKQQQKSIKKQ
jgi:flagellar biosynthesis/type III secretory pathway M-ring protein FliF/YscJ